MASKREAVNFKPMNKRVAVERFETKDKTAGGLYIPETAKEPAIGARVLAVAEGSALEPGNIVALQKYAGVEISINGEMILIVKEEDILGVYSKTKGEV